MICMLLLLQFRVFCFGEGPVLVVKPECLDWKKIPVLTSVCKTLLLSNESPIPLKFCAALVSYSRCQLRHLCTIDFKYDDDYDNDDEEDGGDDKDSS